VWAGHHWAPRWSVNADLEQVLNRWAFPSSPPGRSRRGVSCVGATGTETGLWPTACQGGSRARPVSTSTGWPGARGRRRRASLPAQETSLVGTSASIATSLCNHVIAAPCGERSVPVANGGLAQAALSTLIGQTRMCSSVGPRRCPKWSVAEVGWHRLGDPSEAPGLSDDCRRRPRLRPARLAGPPLSSMRP